jgi:glycosyltransferase involved in cell wall biosynthesis
MLLELVMIVKNSGDDIVKMLEAARDHIDHWTILDTGSTDNTMENITKTLENVPGTLYNGVELYDDPFVDFSTARNRALDLAGDRCTFTIMLDDTYNIHDGALMRKFLQKKVKCTREQGYYIIIEDEEQQYPSTRVLRSADKIRYKHKIHETVVLERVGGTTPGGIHDHISSYMKMRSSRRRASDIVFLREEIEKDPSDSRMRLHLAHAIIFRDKKGALEQLNTIIALGKTDTLDYESRIMKVISEPDMSKNIDEIQELAEKYTTESEPAYFMALLKKREGNYKEAYTWIIKASSTTSEIAHTVQKHINEFEIPYIFADLCIQLGKLDAAEKIIKTYLPRTKDPRLLNMVYAISNIPQTGLTLDTPIIVFHATDLVECWYPGNYKGIGNAHGSGSEIMACEMAKQFSKMGFRVFVFGKFEGIVDDGMKYDVQGVYNGVQYIDSKAYQQFIETYKINILIVSRDTSKMSYHKNVQKVFLWLHDVLPFNTQSSRLLHIQYDKKRFKKILCLCNWHKNYVAAGINAKKQQIAVTRNAIDTRRFSRQPKKIPYRFIYASSVDRGLEHLLRMIPKIHAEFPETTLHIFANLEGTNVKGNNKFLQDTVESLSYVTLRDRVTQAEIAHEYSISDVWLYPTDFTETYCITALEAQAAGLLCVCTGLSSLPEIVGARGIIGGKNIHRPEVEEDLLQQLFRVLRDPEEKARLTNSGREWAMKQSFENLAKDWKDKLFCL